jgi:acyl-CoA synthetase (AMP-forming)/AMP-acid ligase II
VNILEKHSVSKQHDIAFTFINDLGDRESISYSELYRQSSTIAHYLRNNFVKGDRVVILLPQGIEYIYTFIACLQANVVAVPLYPPKLNQHADRVDNVVSDCTPELIITSEELVSPLKEKYSEALVVDKKLLLKNIDFNSVNKKSNQTEENELAFLQYTSGSTGQPKGVMVSHGNIIANLDALKKATQGNHSEVFCNWLPLFHDLGLILTMLLPIFLGAHSVLMSPFHFIRRPLVWLEAISHYKATICGAPNFAFDYCVEKIKDEKIVGLDLSHWRMAYNAAEPVKYNTLKRFAEKFAEQGFRENAICPCYGMAEATVFISSSARLKGYVAQQFDSEMLGKGQAKVSENIRLRRKYRIERWSYWRDMLCRSKCCIRLLGE